MPRGSSGRPEKREFKHFTITVTRLGDRLFAQSSDQSAFEVFAVSDT